MYKAVKDMFADKNILTSNMIRFASDCQQEHFPKFAEKNIPSVFFAWMCLTFYSAL